MHIAQHVNSYSWLNLKYFVSIGWLLRYPTPTHVSIFSNASLTLAFSEGEGVALYPCAKHVAM